MKEIIGVAIYEFKYYRVDNMENPRGYENLKEECEEMAKNVT